LLIYYVLLIFLQLQMVLYTLMYAPNVGDGVKGTEGWGPLVRS